MWLQDMQLWVDKILEEVEPAPSDQSQTKDHSEWQGHIIIQGKLDSGAPDLKIPPSAVPNVMACWNARRNRLGLGMQFSTHIGYSLYPEAALHDCFQDQLFEFRLFWVIQDLQNPQAVQFKVEFYRVSCFTYFSLQTMY